MKLEQKVNEYATNAPTHGRYRVADNTIMQLILSKNLYSDPIESIVRELSINACEAHFDAGHNNQFDVHLPTYANPEFTIRDYGTGLSKEKLETLYTTYGASTKRQSDEYTGGFGIGSKSPFAYADMFYVTSYHNGIKYLVINSQNARGEFVYDILVEEETNEPNGLEITFEVKSNDVNKFSESAQRVYKWFAVPPKINTNITITKPKAIETGPGWEVTKYCSYYESGTSFLVVGQVAYKIDSSHFKGDAKTVLDKCSMVIHAGVGEISIAPNRETIKYSKLTVDQISEILLNFHKYTKDKVEKAVVGCNSVWEARLLANEYFTNNQFISLILGGKFTFNGQTYDGKDGMRNTLSLNLFGYGFSNGAAFESKKQVRVSLDKNVRFAVYEQGGYAAAKRYVTANPTVYLYVVAPDKKQDLIDMTGILESDLLYTSKFPAVVRQARAKSQANVIQAYRYRPGQSSYSEPRNSWRSDSIDLDAESGYYCPIKQFWIENANGTSIRITEIADHLDGLNIIGVLASREEKIKAHANWKHINEHFKDELDKLVNSKEVQTYSDITEPSAKVTALLSIVNRINPTSALFKHLKHIETVQAAKPMVHKFKTMKEFYKRLGGAEYKVTSPKMDLNFDLKDYPLLQYIETYHFQKQEVIDYINSI